MAKATKQAASKAISKEDYTAKLEALSDELSAKIRAELAPKIREEEREKLKSEFEKQFADKSKNLEDKLRAELTPKIKEELRREKDQREKGLTADRAKAEEEAAAEAAKERDPAYLYKKIGESVKRWKNQWDSGKIDGHTWNESIYPVVHRYESGEKSEDFVAAWRDVMRVVPV